MIGIKRIAAITAVAAAGFTGLGLAGATAASAAPVRVVQPFNVCNFNGFGGTIESATQLYVGVTGGSVQYGEGFSQPAPFGTLFGANAYSTCFNITHPQFGTNNDKTFQIVSGGQPVNEFLTEINTGIGNPSEHFNVRGVNGSPSTAARWIFVQNPNRADGHGNWVNEETGDYLITTFDHSGLATVPAYAVNTNSASANFRFRAGQ